jgi:hypothetical protein
MKTIVNIIATAAVLAIPIGAAATPRPLPFTYPVETLQQGEVELEVYGDMTPLRVYADPTDPSKGRLWEPAYVLQNEFEYGLTDRIEVAFYQQFEANPVDGGSNGMTFDGFKWEMRGRLADPGEWPIDVGIYGELELKHDELSLETKVLLAKHFGRLHWMTNLWVEWSESRPYDSSQNSFHFILNPTTGFAYQVTPTFHPGIEYWAHGELGTVGSTPLDIINNRIHHFIGPTVHLNFGKAWMTLGGYADLNNANKPQPGEIYGSFWLRTVLGLNL